MKKVYTVSLEMRKVEELDNLILENGLKNRSQWFNDWLAEGLAELKGDAQ